MQRRGRKDSVDTKVAFLQNDLVTGSADRSVHHKAQTPTSRSFDLGNPTPIGNMQQRGLRCRKRLENDAQELQVLPEVPCSCKSRR